MARAKTPFLSLGASGKLAGTLVAAPWKGIKTVRTYSVPANPQTVAQTTSRDAMAAAVYAYRNILTSDSIRAGYNLAVSSQRFKMSGYNYILSALRSVLDADPDASFVSSIAPGGSLGAEFTMVNADDGATGDESGTFDVFSGVRANSLLIAGSASISSGTVTVDSLGDEGDRVYVQLRKAGVPRSGVQRITLEVGASYVVTAASEPSPDARGSYVEHDDAPLRSYFVQSVSPSLELWWSYDSSSWHLSDERAHKDGYWVGESTDINDPTGLYVGYSGAKVELTVAPV